jgi:2-polyprenyl-3-methyl-5-hydroxy-6-metoxy-1,4-benzoquinol methylase
MNSKYFSNRGIMNDFYKKYDLPKYFVDVLPKDKSSHIIDIGCGLGQTLLSLKKEGYTNIKGIDISDEAIKNCKKNGLDIKKIKSIIDFCKRNNSKYDFIIMSHILEHIEKKEIIPTLKTIKENLLEKKGKLFISVPNAQSNTGCYWAYEDFTHQTLFTAGSLLYVLREVGFEKIKIIDKDNTTGKPLLKKVIRKIFLKIYILNKEFWNKITSSSYHKPSPKVFSFDIKVLAEK